MHVKWKVSQYGNSCNSFSISKGINFMAHFYRVLCINDNYYLHSFQVALYFPLISNIWLSSICDFSCALTLSQSVYHSSPQLPQYLGPSSPWWCKELWVALTVEINHPTCQTSFQPAASNDRCEQGKGIIVYVYVCMHVKVSKCTYIPVSARACVKVRSHNLVAWHTIFGPH